MSDLDHPCKGTCSGWKQGYEKGCADLADANEALELHRDNYLTVARQYDELRAKLDHALTDNAELMELLRTGQAEVTVRRPGYWATVQLRDITDPPILFRHDIKNARWQTCSNGQCGINWSMVAGTLSTKCPDCGAPPMHATKD